MSHPTLLAIPVFADTPEGLRASVLAAIDAGACIIELRLDMCPELSDDEIRAAVEDLDKHIQTLLTNRSANEGGNNDESAESRFDRLIGLAPWFDMIDVELATWREVTSMHAPLMAALRAPNPQTESLRDIPRKLILSFHNFLGRPASLQKTLLTCIDTPECDVVKLAWQARSVRDCFEAFEIMRTAPKPVIAIAMGDLGVISRILSPKFGAFAGFACLDSREFSTLGQLSAFALKGQYRWDAIRRDTEVLGVVGHPIAHSLSPAIHNDVFTIVGRNAVYVPFDVAPGYEAFKALMVELRDRRWLDMRGLSVTLPHKEFAFRYLSEEGGSLDDNARRIGAVNTIRVDADGRVSGTNTDLDGALQATRSGCAGLDVERALVLGAGGVARAVVAALLDLSFDVIIANRTDSRGQLLADQFGVQSIAWNDRTRQSPQIIVNCTSAGMMPDIDESPWPADRFSGVACVIDTVYRPAETRLVREAREAGCRVVNGLGIFAAQAARQYQFWTGLTADDALYQRAVERAVNRS